MAEFSFPREGYHTSILGTTGSGKSTLGAYLIAKSPFHLRPQFVIDFKGEDIFASLSRIREIGIYESLPTQPGLYIVRPRPDQQDEVEAWLEKLWTNGRAGLYIDEGYLMPDKKWLRNVLAQGRSIGITVITTSQRPVDVSRSVFTEAAYVSVFRLNDKKDKQRVGEFTPDGMLEIRLPDYHSFWYSPLNHKADDPRPYAILSPVPGADAIVAMIDERLRPRHTLV
jgi:DNA helicase HerA-like ATPase